MARHRLKFLAPFICCVSLEASTIADVPGGIRIEAAPLVRVIEGARTTSFTVAHQVVATAAAADVVFIVSETTRKPPPLARDAIAPLDWSKGQMASTEPRPGVSWINVHQPRPAFAHTTISKPRAGVTRAVLDYSGEFPLSVTIEVYDQYAAIRKWIEIRNPGEHWVKIDHLALENLHVARPFDHAQSLTPADQGAGSSIVAFSNAASDKGMVAASEVPSALRVIGADAAMGYSSAQFEWVLGPGETFTSEPVFYYGFAGPVIPTISAPSTPLDRTIESEFQSFLRRYVGITSDPQNVPAPMWVTWSNFRNNINDQIVREQAALAAKAGFAAITLDQGWQEGLLGAEPDTKKFPDFAATAAYIRSLGLRLGLWVASLRQQDSPDAKLFPNAISAPVRFRNPERGVAMSFASPWKSYYLQRLIEDAHSFGVTYFKQDFTNIQFGNIGADSEGRTLKDSVLRGLRNLLLLQDELKRQVPGLTAQMTHEIYWGTPGVPCDLAVLKHADSYHIPPNDYLGDGKRNMPFSKDWKFDPAEVKRDLITGCWNARKRFYEHRGLPLYAIEYYGAATMNITGSLTPEIQDRQICSWLMGAPLVFAGDLRSLSDENISRYRQRFEQLRRLEKSYGIYGHFQFSGVPAPTDTDWHWWGKLNAGGEGAVIVIRGSAGEDRKRINIPWVSASRHYKVHALLGGADPGDYSGEELQTGKLTVALPREGQEILELAATEQSKD